MKKARQFEVCHIRGRRITGTTTVYAMDYRDAEKQAKPELKKLGVLRYRIRDVSAEKKSPHVKTMMPLRNWGGHSFK